MSLSELVGHPVVLDVRRRELVDGGQTNLGARGPLTLFDHRGGSFALEVEAEAALAIVGALAGGKTLPRIARGRAVEPEVEGALAGVALWLARRVGLDEATLTAVGATTGAVRARLAGSEAMQIDVTVRIGALKSATRLLATVPSNGSTTPLPATRTLEILGEIPLSVDVVLGAGWAPRREMALQPGDVVVIDGLERGRCLLTVPGANHGLVATMLKDGRVRVGPRMVPLAPEPPTTEKETPPMTDVNPSSSGETVEVPAVGDTPLAEALAEMPVQVRAEAGTVTMPARAWAAMGPGDVVVLDRRVGESVLLRIGGRVVGRGELVDVDGVLGVRIVERTP